MLCFYINDSRELQELHLISFALGGIRKGIVEVSQVCEKLIYKLKVVKVKVTKPHIYLSNLALGSCPKDGPKKSLSVCLSVCLCLSVCPSVCQFGILRNGSLVFSDFFARY